jgi:hypothetical protein
MRWHSTLASLLVAAALSAACGGGGTEPSAPPPGDAGAPDRAGRLVPPARPVHAKFDAIIGITRSMLYLCYPGGGSTRVCWPSGTVTITNLGSGRLDWSASSDRSWLHVSPVHGTAPTTVRVSVDPTGLARGTYAGRIRISAPSAINSPQAISVSFTRR